MFVTGFERTVVKTVNHVIMNSREKIICKDDQENVG